jgi:hypothetical protein
LRVPRYADDDSPYSSPPSSPRYKFSTSLPVLPLRCKSLRYQLHNLQEVRLIPWDQP